MSNPQQGSNETPKTPTPANPQQPQQQNQKPADSKPGEQQK